MPRLNLVVSKELAEAVETSAEDAGVSRGRWFSMAIALYYACHKAKQQGKHIGLVSDPSKLDTEFVWLAE